MMAGHAIESTALQVIARHVCRGDVRLQRHEDGPAMRRALVDTLAVGLAAGREPIMAPARRYVAARGGRATSLMWTEGLRADEESAAWFNAVAAHALDYDDVSIPVRGHLSVVLFPALLALAEHRGQTWGAVFEAYVIGTQVGCAMGQAFALPLSVRGWHTTAVIGMLAATAACARLLQLNESATAHALGLSVAGLAGNLESFGTWAKPMQAGRAASEAIRSARLAEQGFTGPMAALEGERGFLRLYVGSEDSGALMSAWARCCSDAFRVRDTLEIKKYPACYAAYRALDALHELRAQHGGDVGALAAVDVLASSKSLTPLVYPWPANGLQAKFSLPYCLAAVLVDGRVQLASFTDEAVGRPLLQAWMARIRVRESDDAHTGRWAQVAVTWLDGTRHVARSVRAPGTPGPPLSDQELAAKVRDCLAFGGSCVPCGAVTGLLAVRDEDGVGAALAGLAATTPVC